MTYIPAILNARGCNSAISTERALKQVLKLLEEYPTQEDNTEDRINASIDDIKFMLSTIK